MNRCIHASHVSTVSSTRLLRPDWGRTLWTKKRWNRRRFRLSFRTLGPGNFDSCNFSHKFFSFRTAFALWFLGKLIRGPMDSVWRWPLYKKIKNWKNWKKSKWIEMLQFYYVFKIPEGGPESLWFRTTFFIFRKKFRRLIRVASFPVACTHLMDHQKIKTDYFPASKCP